MKRKTYIQPEATVVFIDTEGVMGRLENASQPTYRSNDFNDENAFGKHNIFDFGEEGEGADPDFDVWE